MNIVHLDKGVINPGDLLWDRLQQLGHFAHYAETKGLAEFRQHAGDAHAVFTMRSPVTREMIKSAPNLQIICSGTVGYDHIDLEAANEAGITVTHVPSGPIAAKAVAQGTMALLLGLTNHVGYFSQPETFQNWRSGGKWAYVDPNPQRQIYDLEGKTVGLIGFGGIGRCFAELVHPYGLNIIAATRTNNADTHGIGAHVEFCTLPELLSRSDIVSLHCPYTEKNHHLISEATIAQMKQGVIILNTSRGGLIDEFALAAALHAGKVRGAGVDVLSTEPPTHDNPLLDAPHCLITPHNCWTAADVRQKYLDKAIDNLVAFLQDRPQNVVNNPNSRIHLVAKM